MTNVAQAMWLMSEAAFLGVKVETSSTLLTEFQAANLAFETIVKALSDTELAEFRDRLNAFKYLPAFRNRVVNICNARGLSRSRSALGTAIITRFCWNLRQSGLRPTGIEQAILILTLDENFPGFCRSKKEEIEP